MQTVLQSGNISDISPFYSDWFLGDFIKNNELFNTNGTSDFRIKWSKRDKGFVSEPKNYENEEDIKDETTICILIYGKAIIRIDNQEYEWTKEGDYLAFRPNITHSTEYLEDSLCLTIRFLNVI